MERDKKQVILMYIDQMNLTEGYKGMILRAVNSTEETRGSAKVIDSAYKYALLVETKVLSSRREAHAGLHLKLACESYNAELQGEHSK